MERGNLSILKDQLPQKQYQVLETMYVTYINTHTHTHTHTPDKQQQTQNTKWHTGMDKVTLGAVMLEGE